jgi:hypothetical protein
MDGFYKICINCRLKCSTNATGVARVRWRKLFLSPFRSKNFDEISVGYASISAKTPIAGRMGVGNFRICGRLALRVHFRENADRWAHGSRKFPDTRSFGVASHPSPRRGHHSPRRLRFSLWETSRCYFSINRKLYICHYAQTEARAIWGRVRTWRMRTTLMPWRPWKWGGG